MRCQGLLVPPAGVAAAAAGAGLAPAAGCCPGRVSAAWMLPRAQLALSAGAGDVSTGAVRHEADRQAWYQSQRHVVML